MAETIDSAVSELQKVVAELEADLNNKEEKESSRTVSNIYAFCNCYLCCRPLVLANSDV